MKCKTSNWVCIYHACMSDDCQKKIVNAQGFDWGKGKCNQILKPDNMKTFELVFSKEIKEWTLIVKFEKQKIKLKRILCLGPKKAEATKGAARYCRTNATHETPISLRIKNKNGQYADEFTYPRSADPRRSKG